MLCDGQCINHVYTVYFEHVVHNRILFLFSLLLPMIVAFLVFYAHLPMTVIAMRPLQCN